VVTKTAVTTADGLKDVDEGGDVSLSLPLGLSLSLPIYVSICASIYLSVSLRRG
jgi:hypothetical protein